MKRLTKSRFKVGSECPTKLYFHDRKEFGNAKDNNEFLKALAKGGFQVGELAKLYHPGGVQVDTLDYDKAIQQTDELLLRDNVIIYEAAFGFENLFVRVDVLVKKGKAIELIEVKAKSFDSREEFEPFDKRSLKTGRYVLKDKYDSYLLDVAFQTYVARKAKPGFSFSPYLMMADRSKVATVDGLNQLFLILKKDDGRPLVAVREPLPDLGARVLESLPVGEYVDPIIAKATLEFGGDFHGLVRHLTAVMTSPTRLLTPVGPQCKGCEFRVDSEKLGLKSGFDECWSHERQLSAADLKKEFVFDVWDFRSVPKVIDKRTFADEMTEADLKMKDREDGKDGLSRTERQLMQVTYAKDGSRKPYFDAIGLATELSTLKFPIHCIDFETTMVAIPFHKGRRPYEQMAFQFSHHVIYEGGRFEHKTEYLDDRKGVFPNFAFVRALRKALSGDDGVIFRFAAHENTVLNQIRDQLMASNEADREELVQWIESITTPPDRLAGEWEPTRQFIDMRDLTLRYYYLPETRGSNSIKKILPAMLNVAKPSVLDQFHEWIIRDEKGRVKDPYKLLPPIFKDFDPAELEKVEQWLVESDDLNDGGAAMMAWARMQFSEMSDVERKALREALLRYCKLDTLAMVMIYKWWMDMISRANESSARTG